ncbi:Lyso-phosphatidylcholine acyltransferase [Madurella fahalii]|uniref:Tafazzin family protein n=1 Tax=Madurella fahalii TaxID=1157608 RepID=A0ABQ0GRB4_9PEZI
MSPPAPAPQRPSLSWRVKSAIIMGMTGVISKCFLYGFNKVEVTGLSRFLELLESRRDPARRQRGLLTVSNHISVLDDPVVWGLLPLKYAFDPSNLRWTLGAHDICFSNKLFSSFFNYGQVLPCHRLKHSPFGGPFQPCVAQAIRLLSTPPSPSPPTPQSPAWYTTTGTDVIPSPLTHAQHRRHSWVHVFPEGMVHQHASTDLRYFKWGVARLILESDPAPDVLPMFIDGTQRVMPEDRAFPRFLPRIGKKVRVGFGEVLDYEATFGDLRRRWEGLVRLEQERISSGGTRGGGGGGVGEEQRQQKKGGWGLGSLMPSSSWAAWKKEEKGTSLALSQLRSSQPQLPGELATEELKYGREAQEIRIEVARRLRDEILKVRKSLGGFPEPDPSFALAETWRPDESIEAKKYTSRVDGSNINQN